MTLKGPHDGRKHTYFFGTRHQHKNFKVEASSLAKAIRAFRVGALFPHQYSTGRIPKEVVGDQGYITKVYLDSEPQAYIPVHDKKWNEVAQIPPEGDDEDFGPALLAAQAHLAVADPESTALQAATATTGLQTAKRREMEEQTLDLQAKMGELERQKREMQAVVSAMQTELKQRMEQIWLIELFLGSKEEVVVLAEGQAAPADTPIVVRQQVLCMDEEMAVYDWFHQPELIGKFDCSDLEEFDQWLTDDPEHLEQILPEPKGIVGLRVRRNPKERGCMGLIDIFKNIALEEADAMTYLLVRNGKNLYRLWADVQLFPRLFASKADSEAMLKDHKWDSDKLKAKSRMKKYVAGLMVVQGLIERSHLLYPLPKQGLSVFNPEDDRYFQLIRDDEGYGLLADGQDELQHMTWRKYRTWLEEQVAEGVRVQWSRPRYDSDDKLEGRTGIKSVYTWPDPTKIYTIDKMAPGLYGKAHTFLYLPDEEIYVGHVGYEYVGYKPRSRKVRFDAYSDELLPADFISWRVLEHLILDRNQRSEYGRFFAKAFRWWSAKKDESERERPFVDLVLKQAGVALDNEAARARCERLVRWWKLKTKHHRDLGTDEAKALRMITKAFVRGDDHDNDPEALLFRDRV